MLIRGQNKDKTKDRLMVFGDGCILHVIPCDDKYIIAFCVGAEQSCMSMGKYETAGRCAGILDEIQDAYNYLEGACNKAPKNLDGAVYQMPEE